MSEQLVSIIIGSYRNRAVSLPDHDAETKGDVLQPSYLQFIKLERVKFPLVNQFYKRVYKKGQARKAEAVFILKNTEIICAAKLKGVDGQLLLSGVACEPKQRGQGYASLLIKKVLLLQKQPVYCFPYTHLLHFYTQLGFIEIDLESVPDIISKKFNAYSKNRKLLLMVYPPQ
ncbi:MAG: GNAT family N-acetyltransferase [Psychromonas sp.]|nr:GNAT family N-acetyltransferase [Psychromonas sp.]